MAVIYRILNVVTDHIYIGSARNPKKRKWEHWNDLKKGTHHCAALQTAWNEYGPDAFEFEILEEVLDEGSLLSIEDTYLFRHAGQPNCYNTALSSVQPPSVQPSTIQKIRETSLRKWAQNPSSHPRLGKTHSEETKAKISESKRRNPSRPWLGKTRSEETKAKIGAAQKGVPKKPRSYSPEGLARAQENMRRNAKPQAPKDISEVLKLFPSEVASKYDFSNAVYTGALVRITGVKCPSHGEFSQYAAQFRKGRGCPSCGAEQRALSKKRQMKEFWGAPEGRKMFVNSRKKVIDTPQT